MKTEPAVIVSLVAALLSLGVAFGLELSGEQTAAIMAVVQIVSGLVIRSQVTPVGKLTRDARGRFVKA